VLHKEVTELTHTDTAAGPSMPGGAVAFLFSDIEGSTQHLRALGDDYAGLLEEHRRLLRDAFESHAGLVVDSQGDSFFAVFPRVKDAAAAAAQGQRSLAEHVWPGAAQVRVRMGIHAGEPVVSEGRYVGLSVHRAARICASAQGGQVLLSQAAASLLADNEPQDVSVRDLGVHELKDFDRPEPLYQLVVEGLPSDFPALARTAPTRGIEFRVLGPLEVVRDGAPVVVGGQRQRALLALLLIRANEIVSIERLVDELWGEHPPKTATTSLQNAVVQLRKAIGPDVLVTRHPGYVLKVTPEQLDLAEFESLVRRARAAEPAERLQLLRAALDLWRGAPLADFAGEEFAQAEIRRLDELRLSATEDRIEAELDLGGHEGLVSELESLVGQYPLREQLRGQLMLALYRSGRQAEALDVYHDARRTLGDELGIDPGPALQARFGAILRHERGLRPVAPPPPAEDHHQEVLKALLAARLVPVLGPGVNFCGRPEEHRWEPAIEKFPPGESDVAAYLARFFDCPPEYGSALALVSEYVALTKGVGPLYDELHALLDHDYEPGPVHRLLAALPAFLRGRGLPHQLIVTTSYDDTLEQAFREAGEEFDLVSYVALGRDRGKFIHVRPDGSVRVVEEPNVDTSISTDDRTVILKVHGRVDRAPARDLESFVVSEDDYIDYLAHSDPASIIPVSLAARLRRSHFLFLGYALQDWSLRVFLRRIWGQERLSYRSWAIQPDPEPITREFFRQRDVDVLDVPLEEYAAELKRRADALPAGLPQ
jgi:DNA-binding SARP family transcriptional activator/class 3 adenylate cyclase